MHVYKDNQGRSWEIALTIDACKRVRSHLGIDLLQLEAGEPPLLHRLQTDIELMCDVVYVLCKPVADSLGISDVDFGKSLGGDAIAEAWRALNAELIDFFRQCGWKDRAKAIQRQVEIVQKMTSEMESYLEKLDLSNQIKGAFGETSTKSQGELA